MAQDGEAKEHSPFCAALLQGLAVPGKPVEQLFEEVRAQVMSVTGQVQRPVLCRDPADWRQMVLNPGIALSVNPPPFSPVPPLVQPMRPPEPPPPQPAGEGLQLTRKTTLFDQPGGAPAGEIWPVQADGGGSVVEIPLPAGTTPVQGWKHIAITGWAVQQGTPSATTGQVTSYIQQQPDSKRWCVSPPSKGGAGKASSLSVRHDHTGTRKNDNIMATLQEGVVVEPLKFVTETDQRVWMQLQWEGWIQEP